MKKILKFLGKTTLTFVVSYLILGIVVGFGECFSACNSLDYFEKIPFIPEPYHELTTEYLWKGALAITSLITLFRLGKMMDGEEKTLEKSNEKKRNSI